MRYLPPSPAPTAKPAAPTRTDAIRYHVANYAQNPAAHAQQLRSLGANHADLAGAVSAVHLMRPAVFSTKIGRQAAVIGKKQARTTVTPQQALLRGLPPLGGGGVASMANRRQGLNLLAQRSKQIQNPEGLGSAATSLLDYTTGIPTLVKTVERMRANRGNVQAEVQPSNVLPLVAGTLGGVGKKVAGGAARGVERALFGAPGEEMMTTRPVYEPFARAFVGTAKAGAVAAPGVIGYGIYDQTRNHADLPGPTTPAPRSSRPSSGNASGNAGASPAAYTHQRAEDNAVLSGLKTDIGRLLTDGRISTADAHKALVWAGNVNAQEIRNGRQALHSRYKPPIGGWAR
jgi:hypothetical protein